MVDVKETRREGLDILNDVCSKALFRSVEARGMFSRFLSVVTGISKEYFLNVEYIGGELTKTILTERGKVADIIVKLDENDKCVVEMNKYDPGDIFEKNASYAFSLFNESTKIGKRKRR